MSFARDVSQGVSVPEMRAPVASQSTMGDIAQLATAGANIYKMIKGQEAAEAQKKADLAVDDAVFRYSEMLEDYKATGKPINSQVMNQIENKVLSGITTGPTDKLRVKEGIAGYHGTDFAKAMVGADLDVDKQTREEFRSREGWVQAQAMTNAGYSPSVVFDDLSDKERSQVLNHANQIELKAQKQEADKKDLMVAPNAAKLAKYNKSYIGNIWEQLTSGAGAWLASAQETGELDKQSFTQLRANATQLIDTMIGGLNSVHGEVLKANPNMSQEDLGRMDAILKRDVTILERYKNVWTNMEDDLLKANIELLADFKARQGLEAAEALPVLTALAEAVPDQTLSAMLTKSLYESKGRKSLEASVGKELSEYAGILSTGLDVDVSALANGKLSMDALLRISKGEEFVSLSPEEMSLELTKEWNWIETMLSDPSMVQKFKGSEVMADKFGLAAIRVLKSADELGGKEDIARASTLLGSDSFKAYVNQVMPDPEAAVLSNYVASSVAFNSEDKVVKNPSLKYNSETGKFISTSGDVDPSTYQGAARASDKAAADRLNKQWSNAIDVLVESNPELKGNRLKASRYLASMLPEDQIEGDFRYSDYFKDKEEQDSHVKAIQTGVTLADLQEMADKTKIRKDQFKALEEAITARKEAEQELQLMRTLDGPAFEQWRKDRLAEEEELKNAGTTNTDAQSSSQTGGGISGKK